MYQMCHDSFAVHQLTDSTFICLEHLQLQNKELDVSCVQKEDEKADVEDQVMDDDLKDKPAEEQED